MMDNRSKSLNRRSLLKMGLGVAGAAVALKTGALPAQASSAPSRVQDTLPILAEPDSALFKQIQQAMGNTTGTVSNHILTIDLPRTDQALAMFGTSLSPDMMADTEISFAKVNGQVACKWEMCLLDAEVNGVLTALVNAKLLPAAESFSALHNHYLLEMPRIKFM